MTVFWTSVQSVLMIILMIAIGYFANNKGWFDEQFSGALSKLIMRVALPLSVFSSMISHFQPAMMAKLGAGVIYVIFSILIGYAIAFGVVRALRVPKGRRGLMIAAINFANTVFIGMPLNQALFGAVSVPYVLVYYIVNTALLWTFGVWIIASDDPTIGDGNAKVKFDLAHLLPIPLWGFIIALPFVYSSTLLHLYNSLPFLSGYTAATASYTTNGVIPAMGGLVTPLSLIYIGIMLSNFGLRSMRIDFHTVVTIVGRFVVSPIIMLIIIAAGTKFFGIHLASLFQKTLVIQAATPSFAVLPILANEYHSDVKFATNIVAIASVFFVIVVPVIMLLQNL